MKSEIKYIELKSGYSGNGPAWIGKVEFSKSGQTVYFNGKSLKKLKSGGISGNHYDLESEDEYWISGVKKNGQDRHWAGGGKIMIDQSIDQEYLKLVEFDSLDSNHFELVEIKPTDKQKFKGIENEIYPDTDFNIDLRLKSPNELTEEELAFVIQYLRESEEISIFNKARRSCKRSRLDFEEELDKRKNINNN
ncbi:hypothetical protein [Aureibacter tunicatorum]|uniref:HTH domain antitoxin n=1 Tax=Aureibacter tunicatorum TaxID=866807 RepID=A0AAE3XSI8_9BACT|nr:hypothetical protein [Aureibacter tunicatorum]MDR6241096.1 putative HTH domain antitoxin [Aureibacter tunicatorum]BDD03874.1 hypothetical protein AUTU_13570 [Aureibacter tunicatorum]